MFKRTRIYIYPSSLDRSFTAGMCGTLNSNCRDEFYIQGETKPLKSPPFNAGCGAVRIPSTQMESFSKSWKYVETFKTTCYIMGYG